MPSGLARFNTLRSWVSQWSYDLSQADGLRHVARVSAPLLVVENAADAGVPRSHMQSLFNAAASTDKTYYVVKGASHYYLGQKDLQVRF